MWNHRQSSLSANLVHRKDLLEEHVHPCQSLDVDEKEGEVVTEGRDENAPEEMPGCGAKRGVEGGNEGEGGRVYQCGAC